MYDSFLSDLSLFQVTVIDNGTPALSSTTRVVVTVEDVNDHAPEFEQVFYKVTIRESTSLDMPLFQVRSLLFVVPIPGLIFGIQIYTDSVKLTEHFLKKYEQNFTWNILKFVF
jgi:hypothetical protein